VSSRTATLLLGALLVGGCAGPQWAYDRPGVTAARHDHDLETCRREAFRPDQFALFASQRYDEDVLRRCMERKGYTALPAR